MEYEIMGADEFRAALARNAGMVKSEVKKFFVRAMAVYKQTIWNDPWRVGSGGGGAPVMTGHLRDTHRQDIMDWEAVIGPNLDVAPYGEPVHKYRPWMDYAFKENEEKVDKLADDMLRNLVEDLAK